MPRRKPPKVRRVSRRNASGQWSSRGKYYWSDGKRLVGRALDAYLAKRRRVKREEVPKREARKRAARARRRIEAQEVTALPSRQKPRAFRSTFRHFITNLEGSGREVIDVYVILKRTRAAYVTSRNKKGVRIFAKRIGAMTRAAARKLTVGDLRAMPDIKADPDGILSIHELVGAPKHRTPAKGDPKRIKKAKRYLRPEEKPRKRYKAKR